MKLNETIKNEEIVAQNEATTLKGGGRDTRVSATTFGLSTTTTTTKKK